MEIQKYNKAELFETIKPDIVGNFSLTTLWKLTNGDSKKAPAKWQESEPVQRFIQTASKILNIGISDIIKSKRGKGGGTYGHKQIFIEYAQYLDSELAVAVNEIFFQRIEEEKNPELAIERAKNSWRRKGKNEKWIDQRMQSIESRKHFTSVLAKHGVTGNGFKKCTNASYVGFYGKDAKELRQEKGLISGTNIRENMTSVGLAAISLIENLASEDISKRNLWGNEQCSESAHAAGKGINKMISEYRKRM